MQPKKFIILFLLELNQEHNLILLIAKIKINRRGAGSIDENRNKIWWNSNCIKK